MLKTLATGVCLVVTLAACATPAPRGFEAGKETARAAAAPVGCVAMTGTRIVIAQQSCNGFGNSYSRDALLSTGATDTGEALKQAAGPALTIHRH